MLSVGHEPNCGGQVLWAGRPGGESGPSPQHQQVAQQQARRGQPNGQLIEAIVFGVKLPQMIDYYIHTYMSCCLAGIQNLFPLFSSKYLVILIVFQL